MSLTCKKHAVAIFLVLCALLIQLSDDLILYDNASA